MKTARAVAIASALLAAGLGLAARAQGTTGQRSDCMDDAFKFCSADIPDVPKIEACLETNVKHLSSACRAEFEPTQRTRLKPEHFRKR